MLFGSDPLIIGYNCAGSWIPLICIANVDVHCHKYIYNYLHSSKEFADLYISSGCHGWVQLVRSLQGQELADDGPVSLKKVFQFLHQVRLKSTIPICWSYDIVLCTLPINLILLPTSYLHRGLCLVQSPHKITNVVIVESFSLKLFSLICRLWRLCQWYRLQNLPWDCTCNVQRYLFLPLL